MRRCSGRLVKFSTSFYFTSPFPLDLNYRIDLHDSDIRRLLSSGELNILMGYDQVSVTGSMS